ncbi:MAG: hypothetical protein WD509_01300 [Candidatus Paceibacterota bacterium]
MHLQIRQMGTLAILLALFIAVTIYLFPREDSPQSTQGTLKGISVSNAKKTGTQTGYTSLSSTEGGVLHTGGTSIFNKTTLQEFLNTNTDERTATITGTDSGEEEVLSALKDYGNSAGAIIKSHLSESRDEAGVLDKFITTPKNIEAQNDFKALLNDYRAVGHELNALVPPTVLDMHHKKFADVYIHIGDSMEQLLYSAISSEDADTYNENITLYIDAYVHVAETLRVYGVTFNADEPGSLFTLPF